MEYVLKRATATGQPVMIMYYSKNGLVTKRLVSVERYNDVYIQGFCHLRHAFRRFRRDNVLAVFPASNYEITEQRKKASM